MYEHHTSTRKVLAMSLVVPHNSFVLFFLFSAICMRIELFAQTLNRKQIPLYPSSSNIKYEAPKRICSINKQSIDSLALIETVPEFPKLQLPLDVCRITSSFGWRKHPVTGDPDFHNGIDLGAKAQVVRSMMAGMVKQTGYHRNLGYFVRISHGKIHDKIESVYGHLSFITVAPRQRLRAGDPIGVTGTSGRSTAEHLHFAIRYNDTYIDPWRFVEELLTENKNK